LVHLHITDPAGNQAVLFGLGVAALLLGGFGRVMSLRHRMALSTMSAQPGPDTMLPVNTGSS